jgi:hypothetical protein
VTAPQHTDALAELIQERTKLAGGELLDLVERIRKRLAGMALDPAKLAGPELDAIVDQLIRAMGVATATAVTETGRSIREPAQEMLAYRTDRMRRLAAALLGAERSSLASALIVVAQAALLVKGLEGVISDHEVGKFNAAVLERARRSPSKVAMWVPERDACVRCLRYSGMRLLRPGDRFPGGLSYDPVGDTTDADPVPSPPLHPHCRCELQLVARGDSEEAGAALKREADRSILRGFALESEGQAARRRAAEQLLASGVNAPKSVKADARRRLQAGDTFTRPVPDGSGGGP